MARTAERRICQRFNVGLPVRFSIASAYTDSSHSQKRVFRSLSRNISISGIQIMVQDEALWGLKMGCRLQLEILLPRQSSLVNCIGELRNIARKTESQDMSYLCVEFTELPQSQRKTLERLFVNWNLYTLLFQLAILFVRAHRYATSSQLTNMVGKNALALLLHGAGRKYPYHFRRIVLFWGLSLEIVFRARGSSSRWVVNWWVKLNS